MSPSYIPPALRAFFKKRALRNNGMKSSGRLYNLLTVVVLGMTALSCLAAAATFANPQIAFNPFKPQDDSLPALLPTVPTAGPTNTPITYPTYAPTWTASPAPTQPPATPTAAATATTAALSSNQVQPTTAATATVAAATVTS